MVLLQVLVAGCLIVAGSVETQPANPAVTSRPATGPAASQPNVVQFQPGIRINWTQRQVEIDVTVVLREGQI